MVKDGFFHCRLVRGSNEKTVLEPLASAWGEAAFLHNVIIVHPRFTIVGGKFIMHYNATLCKEALGKFLLPFSFFSIEP